MKIYQIVNERFDNQSYDKLDRDVLRRRFLPNMAPTFEQNLLFKGMGRGSEAPTDYAFITNTDKSAARQSRNTSNEYTVYMSYSDAWSDFPVRNQSIICSTDVDRSAQYGKNYAVIASTDRGGHFGIVPNADIWGVRIGTGPYSMQWHHINTLFSKLNWLESPEREWDGDTLESLKRYVDLIESDFLTACREKENYWMDPPYDFIHQFKNLCADFGICNMNRMPPQGFLWEFLEAAWSPNNGFTHTHSYISLEQHWGREVWAQGEFFMVYEDHYQEVLAEIRGESE